MGMPYLARLGVTSGVACFRVDGCWLRDRWDVDFTNGAHHYARRYVPRDEVWIDREAPGSGEARFLIEHQVRERAQMRDGASYLLALSRASRAERCARRAALDGPPLPVPAARDRVRRERIGEAIRARANVWIVDGRAVRDHLSVDFTLGGHGLRYRFIPRGEIWIDDAVVAQEVAAIVVHEEEELRLMRAGLDYAVAHRRASLVERRFRARAAVSLVG